MDILQALKDEEPKMKKNKYNYLFVVQGRYATQYGWEDLTQSDSYKEAREYLRDYQKNAPEYPHRMIQRRELATVAEPNTSSITSVL